MDILEHSARGATIALEQHELLLLMALVQEGREALACNSDMGQELDQLLSSANVMVEQARRRGLIRNTVNPKIGTVVPLEPVSGRKLDSSNR